jgi:hypothetical protein
VQASSTTTGSHLWVSSSFTFSSYLPTRHVCPHPEHGRNATIKR